MSSGLIEYEGLSNGLSRRDTGLVVQNSFKDDSYVFLAFDRYSINRSYF
jgi:hypothetical protein